VQKKDPAVNPEAAFYQLLDDLLLVSRHEIQEAFEPAGTRRPPYPPDQSHDKEPDLRSRTETSA